METSRKRLSKLLAICAVCIWLCGSAGCSSLGLSVWPAQFQLLSTTKALAAAAPVPSDMPHELLKYELQNYFVEPGDRILIEPVDLESRIGSLGDQKIQIDGTIDLAEFGRLRVIGMTIEEIERAIEAQIAVAGEPQSINVQLAETNAAEVYVLGEVGSPAAYPIDGHEHVLDAILRAGGLTSKASPCDIVLVRPTHPQDCRVVLPVCYRQITQLGDVATNYQLQPGDRIVVGSRSFVEELAFWKQKKSCRCCCRSCRVECQPEQVQYDRRFATPLQPFLLPPLQTGDANSAEAGSSNDSNSYFRQPDSIDNSETSDDDLFLPPIKNAARPKQ